MRWASMQSLLRVQHCGASLSAISMVCLCIAETRLLCWIRPYFPNDMSHELVLRLADRGLLVSPCAKELQCAHRTCMVSVCACHVFRKCCTSLHLLQRHMSLHSSAMFPKKSFFQCVEWTWCVVIICAAMQYVLWSALLGPNQFLGVRVAQSAFVTAAVVDGFHKRFVRVFC